MLLLSDTDIGICILISRLEDKRIDFMMELRYADAPFPTVSPTPLSHLVE